MISFHRASPKLLPQIQNFFHAIDTPSVRQQFSPHEFTNSWAKKLSEYRGQDEYVFAMSEGKIVGYGMLRGWDEGFAIPSLGLCTHPDNWGKGIGTEILSWLITRARDRGANQIILKVKKDNERALKRYHEAGFLFVASDDEYLRGRLDLVESRPPVSILITTINEEENIRSLIPEIQAEFQQGGVIPEINIIDGNSTDQTVSVASLLGCRVFKQQAHGYASAIREGLAICRGRWIIVMDGDRSHTGKDAFSLWRNRKQADVVINSRYVKKGGTANSAWRNVLSLLLNQIYRTAFSLPYREISGGFRIYRREVIEAFSINSKFYEVQEELLLRAHWAGFTAVEIPYTYQLRDKGQSKAHVLKYGYHLFLAVVRLRAERRKTLQSQSACKNEG